MTKIMDRVLDDIQTLSQNEKNNLLKYLTVSMDETHDKDADELWANLAKKRYDDIQSGNVQTVSWDKIKQEVLA